MSDHSHCASVFVVYLGMVYHGVSGHSFTLAQAPATCRCERLPCGTLQRIECSARFP